MSDKTCVLDFGHGGRDPGSVGNKTQEKNNNLNLGLKVGKILQQHGVIVNYTRITDKDFCNGSFDVNEDLQNRIAIAKQYNPDVFCSLHNNAYNKQAKGNECHCFKFGGTDEKLSRSIQNNMVSALNTMIDRKVKASNFYVLRLFDKTNTDACLIEYGFIDSEENLILANMDIASVAISKGVLEYLGIKYVSNPTQTIQSTINNNQGDEFIMEHAVFYFTERDFSVARMISAKLKDCAMYCRNGVNVNIHADIKNVKHPIFVGGSEYHVNSNTTNCCGEHDYDTAIIASNYAKTL